MDQSVSVNQPSFKKLIQDLYQQHFKELCGYLANKFTPPPEPEDVVQSTFERFSRLDDPTAVDNPRAFLYKMAQNIVIDHKRGLQVRDRHAEQVQAEDSERDLDDCGPSLVLSQRQELDVITQTLESLPEKQRNLLLLNRIHHLSYAEISRRTGISQTEAKRQVAKAVAACSKAIEQAQGAGQ